MPIVVKDYTWEENENSVNISVPLKGVKANKVDVFSTDQYLKVSYPPYLFEVLLNAPVVDKESRAVIGNGVVLFKLLKKDDGVWGQLASSDMGDKEKMKAKREESVEYAQQRAAKEIKEKANKKQADEKIALKKAMAIDEEERNRIAAEKQSERDKATEDLENWKERKRLEAVQDQAKLSEARIKREQEIQEITEGLSDADRRKPSKPQNVNRTNNMFSTDKDLDSDEDGDSNEVSEVRRTGKIKVKFSSRDFPTAARESTNEEEQRWLQKQKEAMKIAEIEDADLTEEEKNPVWLKEKGDSFFKSGNYVGAINAYSHAIRLDRHLPSLYSNRATCHLKIGNLIKCVEDCSKALELLTPPVAQNASSRCKAHIRRGTAFCKLELYVEGLQDYDAALKIDPSNENVQNDAEKIRQVIQSSAG